MNLQRKIAAKILKCGVHRVWLDPLQENKIKQAITRRDIKGLIKEGYIKKLKPKKHAKLGEKTQQRTGSKKGKRFSRLPKKEPWLKIVRPQRTLIREMKNELQPLAYRKLYRLIKGGTFRSKAHLMSYIKDNKLAKEKVK